jgi:hypothetical protein
MSGPSLNVGPEPASEESLLTSEPVVWYDRWAAWLADRCSPILVKECRQALKSRQFLWTFLLLLLSVVAWSFWGLSLSIGQPSEESGPLMLAGYLMILAVPLFLVVPFATFRSLVSELETETMPLLTITTMTPYRIVTGKLLSSLMQLLLYLSAVVPCIAFTYLLRGVDLAEVGLLVGFQVAASVALSGVALLAAALARMSAVRWVISVALIFLLLVSCVSWLSFQSQALSFNLLSGNDGTWSILLLILLAVASTGWVGFHTAAALVSFPASNRSSRIRLALLLQHLVLIGCVAVNDAQDANFNWVAFAAIASAHYWLILGSLTSAENPGLSERVRRELPRSVLGQSLFGLLMPGPGRGYLFALTQLWGWQLALLGWWLYRGESAVQTGNAPDDPVLLTLFFVGNACHATFYLSFNWLLLGWIRGPRKLTPMAGLITLLLTFVILSVATLSLHGFITGTNTIAAYNDYSIFLTGNWWSWLSEFGNFDAFNMTGQVFTSTLLIACVALLLGGICLFRAARELVAPPGIVPERVLAELVEERREHAPAGESIAEILAARNRDE